MAVVLREGPAGLELLLAERAHRPGDRWSGHLAFPGGLEQPGDADARATAAREAHEEAGIDLLAGGEVLGELSDLLTARPGSLAPLVVRPVVFAVTRGAELVLGAELSRAHWVPLDELARLRRSRSRMRRALGWFAPGGGERVAGTMLWGLTLAMLDDLLARLEQ